MNKILSALTALTIVSGMGINAHAAERLDRQYIEKEIWSEVWQGKDDNGVIFPEASYKHYLLDKWIDDNYGSEDYDWSSVGELKYQYKRYYQSITENWDFNDDENGNWTIKTEDNIYRFELSGGQWNMIDKNGDTVLMFPVYSTLNEDRKHNYNNSDGADSNRVIGNVNIRTETPSESVFETSEGNNEGKETGDKIPLIIGGIVAVVIGAVAILIKRKKR